MPDRTLNVNDDRRVREEAADWFVQVNAEDAPLEIFESWQRWLEERPAHQSAYREIEDTWQAFARVPRQPRNEDPSVGVFDAEGEGLPPVADGTGGSKQGWWRLTKAGGVRAALVLGAIGIAMLAALILELPKGRIFARSGVLQTSAGENREFVLADGSHVAVGAATLITTDLNSSTRTVIIDHGEAFFDVAHEERPFVVRAGSGTITALGTAFNVHYVEGRVVVTVTEGRVEVAELRAESTRTPPGVREPRELHAKRAPIVRIGAGEQATYGRVPMVVQSANVELAKAWQAGQLRYIAQPLEFVLPDVSRYTRTQLVIADEAVGELRFTGTILQDDVDHWLESLEQVFPIEVVRLDEDTVLLRTSRRENR